MSCLPQTPISDVVLTPPDANGWVAFNTPAVVALLQYYGVAAEVMTFPSMAHGVKQHLVLNQFEFEETASSAAKIKKAALQIHFYSATAPSAPLTTAVYNTALTYYVGTIEIATADYKRVSDTVWTATVRPSLNLRTGTVGTATILYAVVLANAAVTYIAGVALKARPTVTAHSAL